MTGTTVYRGTCVPITDLAIAQRYMEACAAGDQRTVIDIVVQQISSGERSQWWNGGEADDSRGAGGWWCTNEAMAWKYAYESMYDHPGIPVLFTAQDDPTWEPYHEEDAAGTWWWHLPPGTPVNLTQAVAVIRPPSEAQSALESFAGQGQWATISEFSGTPRDGIEVPLPLGRLPRTAKLASVRAHLHIGALDPGRLGQCYNLALKYVKDHDGWVLVHGRIGGPDAILARTNPNPAPPIGHAWAISADNNTVWEPISNDTYPALYFMHLFGADEWVRYTQTEALVQALKTSHWGPWDADYLRAEERWSAAFRAWQQGQVQVTAKTAGTPSKLFHAAPKSARDSIAQHGLDWTVGNPDGHAPNGNFFHVTRAAIDDMMSDGLAATHDLYEVNVRGLGLHFEQDPYDPEAIYTPTTIPPERLRRLSCRAEAKLAPKGGPSFRNEPGIRVAFDNWADPQGAGRVDPGVGDLNLPGGWIKPNGTVSELDPSEWHDSSLFHMITDGWVRYRRNKQELNLSWIALLTSGQFDAIVFDLIQHHAITDIYVDWEASKVTMSKNGWRSYENHSSTITEQMAFLRSIGMSRAANSPEDLWHTPAHVVGTPGGNQNVFYNRDTDTLFFTDSLAPKGGPSFRNEPGVWGVATGAYFTITDGEIVPGDGTIAPTSQTVYNPLLIEALERLVDTFPQFGRFSLREGTDYASHARIGTLWDFLRSVNDMRAEYADQHERTGHRHRQPVAGAGADPGSLGGRAGRAADRGMGPGLRARVAAAVKVTVTESAKKAYNALPANVRPAVLKAVKSLRQTTTPVGFKGLTGGQLSGYLTLRVTAAGGEYRVVYRIVSGDYVQVIFVGPRENLYNEVMRAIKKQGTRAKEDIYGLEGAVREEARQLSLAECSALARRILTETNFPHGDEAEAVRYPHSDRMSCVAWDMSDGLGIPLVALGGEMQDELTVIHECAHILRNGREWIGRPLGDESIAHDDQWFSTYRGLVLHYASSDCRFAFELAFDTQRAAKIAAQTRRLWRGLQVADATDEELEAIRRDPAGFARQHLNDPIGIHWTDDPTSAWNFSQGRDPEGWASESDGFDEDEGGIWTIGLVLEGEVAESDIVQPGTAEHDGYAFSDAILDYGIEREVTVRGGTPVRLTSVTVTAVGENGADVDFHAGLGMTKLAWNTNGITLFHGTIGFYADRILRDGLKPRDMAEVQNHWDEKAISHPGLVYLSHESRMTVSRLAMAAARKAVTNQLYPIEELEKRQWAIRPDSYSGRGITPEYTALDEQLQAMRAQIAVDPRLESVLLAVTIPRDAWGNLEPDEDTINYAHPVSEMTGMPEWMGSLGADAVVAYRGEIPPSWIRVQARAREADTAGVSTPYGDDWRHAASLDFTTSMA